MGLPFRSATAALAVALAGPLSSQTVKVDFNDKVDFAGFRSYAWKEVEQATPGPLNHEHLTRAVERALEAKGLVKAGSGPPDVLVRYFARIGKRTRGTSRAEDSRWQPAQRRTVVEFSRVEEIKLTLELYTPAGLEPAWSAVAMETLGPADRLEQQIDETVLRLLAQYPPKPR